MVMRRGTAAIAVLFAGCGDESLQQSIGEVFVFERTMDGTSQTIITAGFETRTITSSRDDGPCHIESHSDSPFQNAGTLTVDGAGGNSSIPMEGRGAYGTTVQGLVYSPGEQLNISASGAKVPTFSGSLVFPPVLALSSVSPIGISKAGLSVTWAPTTEKVSISIGQGVLIECLYAGADGAATIGASALADLTSDDTAFVMISSKSSTHLTAGDYEVALYGLYQPFARTLPVQP
jgi:hypothetical protein